MHQARISERRWWTPAIRDFVYSVTLLLVALGLAVAGILARGQGQGALALALSVGALGIAATVTVLYVPRLARRISFQYWGSIRLFRVTPRGALFLFLLVLIAASTLNTGNNLLVLVLSFLMAALLVSGMVSNLVLHGLRVSLSLPEAIHAGQRVVSLLTLHNEKKHLPSFALSLRGKGDIPEGATDFFSQEKHFPFLRAGTMQTVRVESTFHRRGVYPVSGFEVRTKFPFGFFFRGREVPAEGKVTVYPAMVDLRGLLRRFPYLRGPEAYNRRGSGTGLYNIRDYQRGDDSRHIHWKSTAKLSRLMVKEFVDERDDAFQVVLSTYLPQRTDETLEAFERALCLVASLAGHYRNRGIPFSFYSGEFEIALNGWREHFDSLMEYLAWVQPSDRMLIDPGKVGKTAVVFTAGSVRFAGPGPVIDYLTA
ncbi:MAG: DUF58 domain-containing protein [Acidobacteriota bacterium]